MFSSMRVQRFASGLICLLALLQGPARGQPAEMDGNRGDNGEVAIGVILAVRGRADIRRADGARLTAAFMVELRSGDVVATMRDARLQIRFSDGSMIILEENTTLEIFTYDYRRPNQPDAMLTKLNSGTIHVTTGMIAVRNPANVYTLTPVARVALDPAARQDPSAGTSATDGSDALPERPAFFSITATYDSTTTLFIAGAGIIVYSRAGAETMSRLGRSFTVTEPGVSPEVGGAHLPGVDPEVGNIDNSRLPRSKEFLSGFAVGVLDGNASAAMEILSNANPADFHLDDVVEQRGAPTTVLDGAMSLTIGPNLAAGQGGGGPPAPVIEFGLGGVPSLVVTSPGLLLQSGQITVAGTTDYLGWGNWQATFVNPANLLDTKTYNGVWSATAFAQSTPEAFVLGLNTVGTYNGAALCVMNDTVLLNGTAKYQFNFGPASFSGNMSFPALQMASSGVIAGNGFSGQIDAINSNAAGIQSTLTGGFFGPQANAINGTFQAGQAGNTYNGVFNGQ